MLQQRDGAVAGLAQAAEEVSDTRLPPTLTDVKDLPIPLDPMTGESFEYNRHGVSATLRAAAPPERWRESVSYELKMKP